jgi:hypothetical protein
MSIPEREMLREKRFEGLLRLIILGVAAGAAAVIGAFGVYYLYYAKRLDNDLATARFEWEKSREPKPVSSGEAPRPGQPGPTAGGSFPGMPQFVANDPHDQAGLEVLKQAAEAAQAIAAKEPSSPAGAETHPVRDAFLGLIKSLAVLGELSKDTAQGITNEMSTVKDALIEHGGNVGEYFLKKVIDKYVRPPPPPSSPPPPPPSEGAVLLSPNGGIQIIVNSCCCTSHTRRGTASQPTQRPVSATRCPAPAAAQ